MFTRVSSVLPVLLAFIQYMCGLLKPKNPQGADYRPYVCVKKLYVKEV